MFRYILAPVSHEIGQAQWEHAQALWPIPLTDRQRRIYDFIAYYQRLWGETPLYREIAAACGLRNTSTVQYQIGQLQQLGLLRKPPRLRRAILLTKGLVKAVKPG